MLEVLAEGLLYDDAIDAMLAVAAGLEVSSDRDEDGGGESEIEDAIAVLGLIRRLDLLEVFLEVLEGRGVLVAARDVAAELLELVDLCGDGLVVVGVLDVGGGAFVELGLVHLCARIADDVHVAREEAIAIEAEESGECLEGRIGMRWARAASWALTFFFARSPEAPSTASGLVPGPHAGIERGVTDDEGVVLEFLAVAFHRGDRSRG